MNDHGPVVYRGDRRLLRGAAAAAIAGIVLCVVGAFVAPAQLFVAYLTAYNYVVSIALGALLFLMICHAMHAGWPTLLRRLTEAIVSLFPCLAVLFVPLLPGLRTLYPWLRPETVGSAEDRQRLALKAGYLNLGGFLGRTVFYFAVWILVGYLLRRWSRAQDRGAGPGVDRRLYVVSAILLPLVSLALSFAAFDWVMSLQPLWQSTMFPVRYFASGFLGALALITVLTAAADRAGLIAGINDSHYYALGRLLLAFVIFWAYTEYFQFMLIWIADKPEEAVFYRGRDIHGWGVVSTVLVLAQFVLPFFALLSYELKRRRGPLAAVAAWLLAAHYIDIHWLVVPGARPPGPLYRWIDFAALLAVGGVSLLYGALRLRGAPMVPVNDPALPDALRYESL
jgi:hypothetical protein